MSASVPQSGGQGSEGAVAVFGPSGTLQATWTGVHTPGGAFTRGANVTALATDEAADPSDWASGDVYVATGGPIGGVVDVLRPQPGGAEPSAVVAQLTGTCPIPGTACSSAEVVPFPEGVHGLAVDQTNGDLFVLTGGPVVDVFEPVSGEEGIYRYLFQITGTPGGRFPADEDSIAVDGAGGDLYVGQERSSEVAQFKLAAGDETPTYAGRLTRTAKGDPLGRVTAVAVDPANHDLYVAEKVAGTEVGITGTLAIDVFGPTVIVPDLETRAATEVTPQGATLNGAVNPLGEGTADCHFAWGTTEALGETAACEPEAVADGNALAPVHARLADLQPDTTYYYRVQAENQNGENESESSEDKTFTTTGPGLHGAWTGEVSSTSVTFGAAINPHGKPTTYRFEYLTETEFRENGESFAGLHPATSVPSPDASLGEGEGDVQVSRHVQSLNPTTVYRYRVVVTSQLSGGVASFSGPALSFTTQVPAPFSLLDARAWELVSPSDKQGALIYPIGGSPLSNGGVVQAAADGSAVTYVANAPTESGVAGYANGVQILSTRTSMGWGSRDIPTPHSGATRASTSIGEEYRAFSPDLTSALVQQAGPFTPQISPEATEGTPYLRSNFPAGDQGAFCMGSCYRPLVTAAEVAPGAEFGQPCPRTEAEKGAGVSFCGPEFFGSTPDLRHSVLRSTVALTATALAPSGTGLYEWSADAAPGEALRLVSVFPASEGGSAAKQPYFGPQARVAARRMISTDGSRVFWAENGNGLFLRYNADEAPSAIEAGHCSESGKACTIRLDTVQGGGGGGGGDALFQIASTDGSRAIFKDRQSLTADSGTTGEDLYQCEIVHGPSDGELECRLTDLTPKTAGGQSAEVQGGIIGASEDDSAVYFVANGVLAENEGADGSHAEPGNCQLPVLTPPLDQQACSLYLTRDGVTTYIATLSGEDFTDWGKESAGKIEGIRARVSPDGRWLAFLSDRPLTGYDNRDVVSGRPDEEVYLYDSQPGAGEAPLICASCNPSGSRPYGVETGREGRGAPLVLRGEGPSTPSETTWLSGLLPGWTPYKGELSLYQSRYLSNSGRLFFNSTDALVPHDTNRTWDVYEYEPSAGIAGEEAGTGNDCSQGSATYSPASAGCIDLVSSGTSPTESAFLDASEDGDDVFFLSAAQLTPKDPDSAYDVYDARVGGGEAEAPKQVECAGDACQQPAEAPNDSTPGSLTFQGAGNLQECPKGNKLKQGKCVKQHKKKHHKKHKKKTKTKQTNSGHRGEK